LKLRSTATGKNQILSDIVLLLVSSLYATTCKNKDSVGDGDLAEQLPLIF